MLIVNTCGFIGPAKQESLDALEELAQEKRKGQLLIAAGCLTQRYGVEVARQVKGIDGIMATLGTLGVHGAAITGQGLTMWAEMVMRDSKENYVPVDTGALRASGFVSGEGGVSGGGNVRVAASDIATRKAITVEQAFVATPTQAALSGRTQTSVILGYGGASAPYALAVHENPRSGKTGGFGPATYRSGVKRHKVLPKAVKYKHWARVGEWKFLETPVKKHMGRVGFYIARALDRAIAQARRAG